VDIPNAIFVLHLLLGSYVGVKVFETMRALHNWLPRRILKTPYPVTKKPAHPSTDTGVAGSELSSPFLFPRNVFRSSSRPKTRVALSMMAGSLLVVDLYHYYLNHTRKWPSRGVLQSSLEHPLRI
jgi:hypothetical protein